MTFNIRLDREAISMVVGLVVLAFTFITLMWFPSIFVAALWAIVLLLVATTIAGITTLAVYNLLGKFSEDDDDVQEEVG